MFNGFRTLLHIVHHNAVIRACSYTSIIVSAVSAQSYTRCRDLRHGRTVVNRSEGPHCCSVLRHAGCDQVSHPAPTGFPVTSPVVLVVALVERWTRVRLPARALSSQLGQLSLPSLRGM